MHPYVFTLRCKTPDSSKELPGDGKGREVLKGEEQGKGSVGEEYQKETSPISEFYPEGT